MGIIGVLAILIWLAVPAVRIWRDPGLRSHWHSFGSPDPAKRQTLVMDSTAPGKRTRLKVGLISIAHRATFWDRYRALLIGSRWPPGEACPDWKPIRNRFQPATSKEDREVDTEIAAESITLAL